MKRVNDHVRSMSSYYTRFAHRLCTQVHSTHIILREHSNRSGHGSGALQGPTGTELSTWRIFQSVCKAPALCTPLWALQGPNCLRGPFFSFAEKGLYMDMDMDMHCVSHGPPELYSYTKLYNYTAIHRYTIYNLYNTHP